MSNRHVHAIAGRLSLRPPQRESLELLHEIVEVLNPSKEQDVVSALSAFKGAFTDVVAKGFEEFERDFPSFCYSLATGVGKTPRAPPSRKARSAAALMAMSCSAETEQSSGSITSSGCARSRGRQAVDPPPRT